MNSDFGEYQLLRLLGEGGMAQVWSARRRSLHGPRRCAIKLLAAGSEPPLREMFAQECRMALAVSGHDNVVSVLDMGEHRGRPFLAMELVDGVTLADLARRVGGPWPVAEAVEVAVSILRALEHVHALSVEEDDGTTIVHRDVTPHNIMVASRGDVKLVDFGIAQRVEATPRFGQALGKLSYVPREQVEGEADARSDLFSVGAILFELLDGRPFRWHCADEDAFFQEIYRDRIPSLRRKDLPGPVRSMLCALLQPHAVRRPASATQVLEELEGWQCVQESVADLRGLYAQAVGPRGHHEGHPAQASRPGTRTTGEHSGRLAPAANDSGRSARAAGVTAPQRLRDDVVQRRSRDRTVSVPAWKGDGKGDGQAPPRVTGEVLPVGDPAITAPVVPLVESEESVEVVERFATRRHPAALPELDVPTARRSADIAVTMPLPSQRAPWASGAEPVGRRVVRPEPGAPVLRRRPSSTGSGQVVDRERTGSVRPRSRQSASMHHAAADSEPVSGEIALDDVPDEPRQRVGLR